MTWATVVSTLHAHLVAAGATLTPPITNVKSGAPSAFLVDTIWYEYAGDRESQTGGNTLGKTNLEEGFLVSVVFPGAIRDTPNDGALEIRMRDAARAIKNRLWGDWSIGGESIGVDITDTESDWAISGDSLIRAVQFTVWIDEAWVDDITA
jgi:hypothetical protein